MNFVHPSSSDCRYTEVQSADQDSAEPQQEEKVSYGDENFTAKSHVGKSFAELTAEDVEGREFATLDDAENWYRMYATALGFMTRLQRVTRGIGGRITRRRLVCNKEGKREAKWLQKEDRVRNAKQETRCNCLAACCIHFNKNSQTYIITEFKTEHNHDLAMHSNGSVTNADMGHLGARRTCSVSTSRADDYMVKSNGGFDFVGDTEKDLFDKIEAEPRAKLFKQGEETAPIVEVSDITMPPWSINLVGFGDEYRCDHVDIPRGVTYSYVSLSPHVKAVSADTASTLLRQIAGLTSIATEQSLKARDEILRLKRDSELALKTKEAEAAVLKRELAECRRELELVKSADKYRYRTIEEVGGNSKKQITEDNCNRGQSPEGGADIQLLRSLGGWKSGFAPDKDMEFDSSKRKRR
ncbi:uncharacterized protein LOC133727805 [Rosa rugosa]|uniref:uncharacterized protein LOC133727805 n=1 Tax=Rosa rugosa TaxID=74645 RepID=UPI002B40178E|nr:uncharacterized protein LOC133727805 [Rosa rugosa]XP_062011199.1 uncharacterized protein LOC133727805 [Rosa rugosa]